MIKYMLDKLAAETSQYTALQQEGNFPAAHAGYDLICEVAPYYQGLGYHQEVADIHRQILEVQPTPALSLYFHALILFHRRRCHSALDAIDAAILLAPE